MPQPRPDVLPLGPFRFTPTALEVRGRPPVAEFAGPLRFALWCQAGAPWWIGDLLNAGDERFGEMFSQVCEGQISADQLQRYESVARRVPAENRNPNLSWSAHAAVARLPPDGQRTLLRRAESSGWTSAVLARKARAEVARMKAERRRLHGDDPDEPDDTAPARGEPEWRDEDS